MPLKATRALLGPDGSIYCVPGTVLADDDPVAAKHMNAVVGSTEPVTEGYATRQEPGIAKGSPFNHPDAPPVEPKPEFLRPFEPENHDHLTEQSDDDFLSDLADQYENAPETEPEEDDEGTEL